MQSNRLKDIAEADIFLVSFPKAGRTWLRVLLGKAICDLYGLENRLIFRPVELTKAARLPVMIATHDESIPIQENGFAPLRPDKSKYRDKKIIFMVRDPRDVLVSFYFQATRRSDLFRGPISEFIRNEDFGIRRLLGFYEIWSAARNVPRDFLLVRYEDLHENAGTILRSALQLFGILNAEDEIIERAVQFAQFENMKKLEREGYFESPKLRPADPRDPDSFKVRRGKIGGYRDYLSGTDSKFLNRTIAGFPCPFYSVAKASRL